MDRSRRLERRRATLYVLLIFLCGVVAGALATNLWRTVAAQDPGASTQHVPYSKHRTVEKFTRRFDLTPQQARKLNEILDETRKAYQSHEQEQEVIRQWGRDRIREILSEEQRKQYEDYLARMDAKGKRAH